jgi:hypothetical protein
MPLTIRTELKSRISLQEPYFLNYASVITWVQTWAAISNTPQSLPFKSNPTFMATYIVHLTEDYVNTDTVSSWNLRINGAVPWLTQSVAGRAGVRSQTSPCGILVDTVALGQILSDYLGIPFSVSFYHLPHTHRVIPGETPRFLKTPL